MEDLNKLIKPELLILVPILYLIGNLFKQSSLIKDEFIPLFLGLVSIILCGIRIFSDLPVFTPQIILMALFSSITQGILVASTSVYVHQIYHQNTKPHS